MPYNRFNETLKHGNEARDRLDWNSAAEHYRRYLRAKPRDFAIWVQLGHALKEAGRPVEALVSYSEALALDGRDPDLLLNLGHLHKVMGSHTTAIDYYRRSAAQNGNTEARAELRRLGVTASFDDVAAVGGPPTPQTGNRELLAPGPGLRSGK